MTERVAVSFTVNGRPATVDLEPRTLLADALRHRLGLVGTHLGCEHGVCGACTVRVDGEAVRSCLMLAVQAEGSVVQTVEGLAGQDGSLHPIQEAFQAEHGLQCGFCTPGFLMATLELLEEIPDPSDEDIVDALAGNVCRCTGYGNILKAVKRAAATSAEPLSAGRPSPDHSLA